MNAFSSPAKQVVSLPRPEVVNFIGASTQAAGAGIEAVKSLLSRKVKLIKVTLQAGYQVLLRDEGSKPAS